MICAAVTAGTPWTPSEVALCGAAAMPLSPPEAADAPPLGIICPACTTPIGRDSLCFTRPGVGQIVRVRKCPNPKCRRRVRTAERIIAGTPQARGEETDAA